MCSVIEPETSIRQNITAWATGFGCASKPLVPHVERVDVGDQPGPALLAGKLFLQDQAPFLIVGTIERGDFIAQRLHFLGLWPMQRDAARQAVPHRTVQRQIGRRSADGIAGTMVDQRVGVHHPAFRQIRKFKILQEQVDELIA